jgi:hypothetical protein
MDVGPAEPNVRDSDEHLAGARLGIGQFGHRNLFYAG